MTRNKLITLNIINLIVFLILGITFYSGAVIVEHLRNSNTRLEAEIEEHWRDNSRKILKDTIAVFEYDATHANLEISDYQSVSRWSAINFGGLRTSSFNSYSWIAEIGEMIYIDDQRGRHIIATDDNYLTMDMDFSKYDDPDNAKMVYERILSGRPTDDGDNLQWIHNGQIEWVEFAYYPNRGGLDSEPKTINGFKNENYRKYVFVTAVNRDDIMDRYSYILNRNKSMIVYTHLVMGGSFILSLMFLISIIFIKPFKQRRCV